ncbi:MAG: hypothetical protein U5K55_01395 [Aliarcobacter sp.]|nr:hypothetical protein [Aliarcobacter sp.]
MHKSSYEKMKYFVDGYLTPLSSEKLNILDVGGRIAAVGQTSYYKLFNNENWQYDSLDVQDGEGVSIVINNPYSWNEIGSNTYDVVISGQVFRIC